MVNMEKTLTSGEIKWGAVLGAKGLEEDASVLSNGWYGSYIMNGSFGNQQPANFHIEKKEYVYVFLGVEFKTADIEIYETMVRTLPLVEIHGYPYWQIISNQPDITELFGEELFEQLNRNIRIHFFKEFSKTN